MTQDALRIALEALAVRFSEGWHEGIKIDASDIMLLNEAAQALAQEQEPVAWVCMNNKKHDIDFDQPEIDAMPVGTMLYTHSQRTWVGLTDDEIAQAIESINMLHGDYATEVAYAIEAKLKDKNS